MELKSQEYAGKDRRSNGRLRLTIADGIKVITLAVMLLVGGVIGWTTLKADVNILKEKDTLIEAEAEELEVKHNDDVKEINGNLKQLLTLVQEQAVMNGKVQTTLDYIKKDIEEIKAK